MEQIFVQHFKAIRNEQAVWIPVKSVTVLMGEQASGKSTLAKLIYFFKTLPNEIIDEALAYRDAYDSEKIQPLVIKKIRRYFTLLFGAVRHLGSFRLKYIYASGKEMEISSHGGEFKIYANNWFGDLLEKVSAYISGADPSDQVFNPVRDFKQRMRVSRFASEVWELFGGEKESLYMPASRNMTVALSHILKPIYSRIEANIEGLNLDKNDDFISENELIIYKFIQYMDTLERIFRKGGGFGGVMEDHRELEEGKLDEVILETLISKTEEVLKGKYVFDSSGEKIQFMDTEESVPLSNASSGQQESIRIFQDLFWCSLKEQSVFRVYEEPESHLYPAAQKSLIEAAAAMLQSNPNNQILFPTHSPYTLLALDNLILAGELSEKYPELDDKITGAGVETNCRIRFQNVSAWYLSGGEFTDTLNYERKGIKADFVDQPSHEMEEVFDRLLALDYDHADL